MNAQREALELVALLAVKVERHAMSRDDMCAALDRSPEWLDEIFQGRRGLTLEELFRFLEVLEEEPGQFFAAHYDLYGSEKLGKKLAPGVFSGPVSRFVEEIAQRAEVLERNPSGETDR